MNRRAGKRRSIFALAVLFVMVGAALFAQTPSQPGGDLDNLFGDNGAQASGTAPDGSGTAQTSGGTAESPPAVRPDDPTLDSKIHTFGSLAIYGLFGTGWSDWPNTNDISDGYGNEVSGSFTASLGFQVRPAPQLRIRGTLSYSFPDGRPAVFRADHRLLGSRRGLLPPGNLRLHVGQFPVLPVQQPSGPQPAGLGGQQPADLAADQHHHQPERRDTAGLGENEHPDRVDCQPGFPGPIRHAGLRISRAPPRRTRGTRATACSSTL